MSIYPDKTEFARLAAQGDTVPVYLDLTADCETPLGAYAKLKEAGPGFLFESIVGGERIGRYSFLGTAPRKILRVYAEEVRETTREGETRVRPTPADPLEAVEAEMARHNPVILPGMPPFTGGAVGFVSHEYVHYVEPTIPKPEANPLGLPLLYYLFTESVLVFDHVRQILRVCVQARPGEDGVGPAYDRAVTEIDRIRARLEQPRQLPHRMLAEADAGTVPEGNFTREAFQDAVSRVKSYVRDGDIIQAVLSQRFTKPFNPGPDDLYRALRTVNPSPYMVLLEDPEFSVVGASPEVHVRLTGKRVEIRPIAGTRRRGDDEAADLAMEKDLLGDEKERAEHLMLVDLARNDIGRVCRFGSIHVPEYMAVERYSHVMHIVSQVVGDIREDRSAFDLMRATFPAGTLSGAPKIRALQIIAELEACQRGVYGGAIGYFGYAGNHDSCIGIRTAVLRDETGIVADSDPEAEFMETVNKARAMLKAVALAEAMLGES